MTERSAGRRDRAVASLRLPINDRDACNQPIFTTVSEWTWPPGVRCLQDLVLDDTRKARDPDFYNDLLALELEVCGLEPYDRLGVFTQVLARRL